MGRRLRWCCRTPFVTSRSGYLPAGRGCLADGKGLWGRRLGARGWWSECCRLWRAGAGVGPCVLAGVLWRSALSVSRCGVGGCWVRGGGELFVEWLIAAGWFCGPRFTPVGSVRGGGGSVRGLSGRAARRPRPCHVRRAQTPWTRRLSQGTRPWRRARPGQAQTPWTRRLSPDPLLVRGGRLSMRSCARRRSFCACVAGVGSCCCRRRGGG